MKRDSTVDAREMMLDTADMNVRIHDNRAGWRFSSMGLVLTILKVRLPRPPVVDRLTKVPGLYDPK